MLISLDFDCKAYDSCQLELLDRNVTPSDARDRSGKFGITGDYDSKPLPTLELRTVESSAAPKTASNPADTPKPTEATSANSTSTSPAPAHTTSSTTKSNGGLSTGAKTGIGVGVPLGVLHVILSIVIYTLKCSKSAKRRKAAKEQAKLDGTEAPRTDMPHPPHIPDMSSSGNALGGGGSAPQTPGIDGGGGGGGGDLSSFT